MSAQGNPAPEVPPDPPNPASFIVPPNSDIVHRASIYGNTEIPLIQTSMGFVRSNQLMDFLRSLPPDELRTHMASTFQQSEHKVYVEQEYQLSIYAFTDMPQVSADLTPEAFNNWRNEAFPPETMRAIQTSVNKTRNKIAESSQNILLNWSDEDLNHPTIKSDRTITRLRQIAIVSRTIYEGNLRVTYNEALRAVNRAIMERLKTPKFSLGHHALTTDWEKVAKVDSHPSFAPWSEEELHSLFYLKDHPSSRGKLTKNYVITEHGVLMPYQDCLDLHMGFLNYVPDRYAIEDTQDTGTGVDASTSHNTADTGPGSNTGDNTSGNTGDNTSGNTGDNGPGSNTVDNTSGNTDVEMQDMTIMPGHNDSAMQPQPQHDTQHPRPDLLNIQQSPQPEDLLDEPKDFVNRRMKVDCGCDPVLKQVLLSRIDAASQNNDGDVYKLVHWFVTTFLRRDKMVCMDDLKSVGRKCRLHIRKVTHQELKVRLDQFNDAIQAQSVGAFKTTKPTCHYFNPAGRPGREADLRDQWKYKPQTPWTPDELPNGFNYEDLLDEFFPGCYETYEENGNVNIPVFKWWEETGLMAIFKEEMSMYRFHLRIRPNTQPLGWLRNMYHSIAQQTMRSDPLYWLSYVALRPDHGWRLVSYPYYAKYVSPGDSTAFKHLDVNPFRLADTDYALNMIQGSVSLTHENHDNCTIILPGMHKWIKEWIEDYRIRNDYVDMTAKVVNLNKEAFTDADQKKYSKWTSVPCKAGDARITSPSIGHGSTGKPTMERLTMLPWFELVLDDHKTLELPNGGDYGDLATSFRTLMPPPRTASGVPAMYGSTPYPFPAAFHIDIHTAIGGALITRNEWTMPQVSMEMKKMFLGTKQERAEYVATYRRKAVNTVLQAWETVKALEMEHFGEKSYFLWKEGGGGSPPSEDDPDPIAVDVSATEEALDGPDDEYVEDLA